MESLSKKDVYDKLNLYWKNQKIFSKGNELGSIEAIEEKFSATFPSELKKYFQKLNGMELLYPNDTDEEGFLAYPLSGVTTFNNEFKSRESKNSVLKNMQCLIFMNYLHKSWWYGVLTEDRKNPEEYTVVLISDVSSFKIITNSLEEFFLLYMIDSEEIYY